MPRGKKRSASEVKAESEPESERLPPALRPEPETGTERTFVITREDAMERAGGLREKLGDDEYNQRALVPEMIRWLSKPVIMVLGERMKKKVFDWCQVYDPSWLAVLFEAKGNRLKRYEYAAEEEGLIVPESVFQVLRTLLMELPPDREAYQCLWGAVRRVTTHSQHIFLQEELRDRRRHFEYVPDENGNIGIVLPRA